MLPPLAQSNRIHSRFSPFAPTGKDILALSKRKRPLAPSPRLRYARRTSPRWGEETTGAAALSLFSPSGRRWRQPDEGGGANTANVINNGS
ncbi:hypothetical protein RvVAR0630_32720 [Agrobacterium vitis]|nr:hypothetical protein RvVAR0630_32720 [Agrobacterium vitis]